MRIGSLDTDLQVVVIAEVGNNHEGDSGVARELIEKASDAGVDAVKFQTFRTDAFVSKSDVVRYDRMRRFELAPETFAELAELAHAHGLLFFSTPLDLGSVDVLTAFADALKIASGDVDFFPLLGKVAGTGLPAILSTGQSDLQDVDRAVAFLGRDVGLLHCVTSYPAPAKDVNLRAIGLLAERFPGCTIGYSDHTDGLEAAPLAIACGARIVEKHFTLDKSFSEFRDHRLSADPLELRELVARIRGAEVLLGEARKDVQPSEVDARAAVRRSIAVARALPAGHQLTIDDLVWTRPADGFRPGEEARVLSRILSRDVEAGEHLTPYDLL